MGFRGTYKNKRDANEAQVFSVLESHGIQIRPIDVPCDAIVNFKGWTYLIEVKNGPKAKLTPTQEAFHRDWQGDIHILSTDAEAEAFAKGVRIAASAGLQYRGTIS